MKKEFILINDIDDYTPYCMVITSKPKKVMALINKIKSNDGWCVDDILYALCEKKYVLGIISDFYVCLV